MRACSRLQRSVVKFYFKVIYDKLSSGHFITRDYSDNIKCVVCNVA